MITDTTVQEDLQNIMNKLAWANNKLSTKSRKTKIMKFRRGGIIAEEDGIYCDGKKLESVFSFKYLGITLQTTGTTFSMHVTEQCIAAIKTMSAIDNLGKLSLNTDLKLFKTRSCHYSLMDLT
jgi:hypothetical protein